MIDQTLRGNETSLPSSASTLLARDTIQLVTSLQFQARTSNKIFQQAHLISFHVSSSPQSPTLDPNLLKIHQFRHISQACRAGLKGENIINRGCAAAKSSMACAREPKLCKLFRRPALGVIGLLREFSPDVTPNWKLKNLKSSNSSKRIVCDDKSTELWGCPWKCWWHYIMVIWCNVYTYMWLYMCRDFFDILSMKHVF